MGRFRLAFDVVVSSFALLAISPVIAIACLAVWGQDRKNPFYIAERVGLNGRPFKMIKIRTMVVHNGAGATSTSASDSRITAVGRFLRSYKLDELTQLLNVALGNMRLVGPRPQVPEGVNLYTQEERVILSVPPGITDYSSIVFADESEILKDCVDPDDGYNRLIRPGKSALCIFYTRNNDFASDLWLIFLTLLSLVSRRKALDLVAKTLMSKDAPKELAMLASRYLELEELNRRLLS